MSSTAPSFLDTLKARFARPVTATASGEALKAQALDLLAERRETLVRRARRALLVRLLETGSATADDIRAAVPLPADVDPRAFGAVPGALAREGIITLTGFIKSTRPECHSRIVQQWGLLDRTAAVLWLAAHPDLGDGQEGGDRDE